jgi:PleD family two-component response regulator
MAPLGDDRAANHSRRVLVWDAGNTAVVGLLRSALGRAAEVVRGVPGTETPAGGRAGFELSVLNLSHEEALCTGPDRRLAELVRAGSGTAEVFLIVPRDDVHGLARLAKWAGADLVVHPFTPEELVLRVRRALENAQVGAVESSSAIEHIITSASGTADHERETFAALRFREAMRRARERAARAYLTDLLRQVDGEVARAARRAGLERESLHRLLKRHDIRAGDYRSK